MSISTHSISRWFEVALWLFGLICLSAYGAVKVQSASAQSAAMSDLETEWRQAATAAPDRSLWSKARIERYERDRSDSENLPPLGLLTIPSVGIRVAMFEGTSDRVLNLGVGRVEGTGQIGSAGNLAFAGHRDGFFRGLKDIEVGDDISIQHRGGISHYSVHELSVVEPDAVHVLEPTEEETLTLVTCYPFYFVGPAPKRFIVKAIARRADVFSQ
ncbi:MAG: class D sortase [Gammaproteobacteria bacterium]|nr:class D sortase [Gammaproteobacteria bacterium]